MLARDRGKVGLINQAAADHIAHAASRPTLAKSARMGHPLLEWRTQTIMKGRPPASAQKPVAHAWFLPFFDSAQGRLSLQSAADARPIYFYT